MKKYLFDSLIVTTLFLLLSCSNTHKKLKIVAVNKCIEEGVVEAYPDRNQNLICECLVNRLSKTGFSTKEISWYMSIHTFGYSKLKEKNVAQNKIKNYLVSRDVLNACALKFI